jgi:hypothetical protein
MNKYILKFTYNTKDIDKNLLPWHNILNNNRESASSVQAGSAQSGSAQIDSDQTIVEEYQIGTVYKSKTNNVEFITPFFIHIPYSECRVLIDESDIELKLVLYKFCYYTRIAVYKFDPTNQTSIESEMMKHIISESKGITSHNYKLNNLNNKYYINAVDDTNILLRDMKISFKNMMNENIYPHIWLESNIDLDEVNDENPEQEIYDKIVPGSPVYKLNTDALDSDTIIGIVHSSENDFVNIIPMISINKINSLISYSNIFVDYEINTEYVEIPKKEKQRSSSVYKRSRSNTLASSPYDNITDSLDKLLLSNTKSRATTPDSNIRSDETSSDNEEKELNHILQLSVQKSQTKRSDSPVSTFVLDIGNITQDSVMGLQGSASSVLGLQGSASSVLGMQGPVIIKQTYSRTVRDSLQIGDQIVGINGLTLDAKGYIMMSDIKIAVPFHTYLWYNPASNYIFTLVRGNSVKNIKISSESLVDKISFDIGIQTNYIIIDNVIFCSPNLMMVEWLQNKELIFKNNLYLQHIMNPYYKPKYSSLMVGIINRESQPTNIRETLKPYEPNIYQNRKYVEFFTVTNLNSANVSNISNLQTHQYVNRLMVSDSRENELVFNWIG